MANNYYFSFMQKQFDKRNSYVKITANTMGEARKVMFEKYGDQWAFSYHEEDFLPQIDQFKLTQLEHIFAEGVENELQKEE